MPDFLLPDLGEGLEEAEVVSWHVSVGDTVTVDQIVAEVETAKAAVEIPTPFGGTVTALHAEQGQVVRVGSALISVAEIAPAAPEGFSEPGVVVPEPSADESGERSGNVLVGFGTAADSAPRRSRRRRPAVSAHPPAVVSPLPPTAAPAPTGSAPAPTGRAAVISPLVRRLAHNAGIDIATVRPSHESGIIRRADVSAALEQNSPAADARNENDTTRRIPLRGVRRAVADKLSTSRREIPEATVWVDVDATQLMQARRDINAANPAEPISLLAMVARFTVAAVQRYPELNARVEDDDIVIPDFVNLGFAAQTERGLVVPVVHGAHQLSTRSLSAALAELTSAARSGGLTPGQLSGGTITVNNYGVFGVDGSAAIINHPEVAILGVGRVIDRPWVVDGELTVRKVTQLTLAFDHRVCDGATAGGFLRYIADCVEAPVVALADL